jgi:1-acyl-sn-glycerol-3-phosphate acyltransferase
MPFPGLSGKLFYHTMLMPYFASFTLGWSTRVSGKRNLPRSGPALILSNHQSFLDPMLLGIAAYPRALTFLARKELFHNRLFGPFIRWCGAVPIDQGFGRDGMRAVTDRLNKGEAVVVFPEGERTTTGDLQPLKPGISLLLRHAQWPIIPTGLAGAYAAWPRSQKLPRPGPLFLPPSDRTLAVHFDDAIEANQYSVWDRERLIQELAERIQNSQHRAARIRRK